MSERASRSDVLRRIEGSAPHRFVRLVFPYAALVGLVALIAAQSQPAPIAEPEAEEEIIAAGAAAHDEALAASIFRPGRQFGPNKRRRDVALSDATAPGDDAETGAP